MVSSVQEVSRIRYLLLESRQKKPLLQALYEVAENPQWVHLFADTEWHAYLKESPIVLEASQNSPEYQWALRGLKSDTLSGLILESTKGLEAVSGWARERLTVRFDGNRQGLLRFYDPLIWHLLGPRHKPDAEIIDRAIYWYRESGQQRWLMNENPEPIAMSPVPTLDSRQWLALNSSYT